MGKVGDWLRRRVRDPLAAELRQGASPEGLSSSVAVGAAVGILPFLGTTTLLCALAGRLFRLNHVAIQLANLVLYPLQVGLIVPFVRLGEGVLGAEPMPIDPMAIVAEFGSSPVAFLAKFGWAGVHAFLGWALVVPLAALAIRQLMLPGMRKLGSLLPNR